MKFCIFCLSRLITLIAISLIFAGCTHTVKSAELLPQMQAGSPLKSVSPKTFAFKDFKDARGITDPLLFKTKDGPGEHKLDQPPAVILAIAIKKELERNGHMCIDYSPESKADFIIEGNVYKYWHSFVQGLWSGTHTGKVAVKLTVSSVSDNNRVLTKNYQGEYVLNSGRAPIWVTREVLGQAFLAMLKEISTDSELIEFIEK